MRKLFAFLILIACAVGAQAQGYGPSTVSIRELVPNLSSTTAITMGGTAIEITGNVTAANVTFASGIVGWYKVLVFNNDTTNDIFCSTGDSAVSATGTTHLGINIKHATATTMNPVQFIIPPTEQIFCIAGAGSPVLSIEKYR